MSGAEIFLSLQNHHHMQALVFGRTEWDITDIRPAANWYRSTRVATQLMFMFTSVLRIKKSSSSILRTVGRMIQRNKGDFDGRSVYLYGMSIPGVASDTPFPH